MRYIGNLWPDHAYKRLIAQNLFPPEILEATQLRIESWAHHALMAFTLHSLATNRVDDLPRARACASSRTTCCSNFVDVVLPLYRAKWRASAIASGAIRCT